ncbi:9238_t:CDS:2 [Entrophospora sp. SA101]|nr:9238_t:CDS:2 [Entrophospora sp. SA101]
MSDDCTCLFGHKPGEICRGSSPIPEECSHWKTTRIIPCKVCGKLTFSTSDKYSDNISECESENCSDYGSDYESDIETIKSPVTQPPNIEKQMSNSTYSAKQVSPTCSSHPATVFTKRQEKFDEKFTQQDLLNKIRKISSSPTEDILKNKGDMEAEKVKARDIFIRICCSFIRALYQILDYNGWCDLNDSRVQPPINMNLEVRPRILSVEKINQKKIIVGQDSLKKYANLVLQKYSDYLGGWDIEEKDSQYFVYFNRKAYLECPKCKRLHDKDQRWFGRAYGNGSFIVKCFQQNRDEPGEIFNDPSIAEKIQQKNKNMCLELKTRGFATVTSSAIPPPVIHKVKGPKFPWPFLEMPAWVKCDSLLTATEIYEEQYVKPLPEEGDVYVGSSWGTGKTYTLEHLTIPDAINLLALSTRHTYSSAVTVRLNLKSYCDIETKDINLPDYQRVVCQIESLHRIINKCKCEKKCKCHPIPYDLWLDEVVSVNDQAHTRLAGRSREHLYKLIHDARRIIVMDNDLTDLNIEWIKSLRKGKQFSVIHNTYQPQKGKTFRLASNKETVLAELWDWAKQISTLPFEKRKSASLICHLRRDVQGIVHALRTDFSELCIKEYHGKSDPAEKAQDFGNVDEAWKDVDLVAYTSTLKIGVSCTNIKFERAFCLFNSYIETNAGTNQMLFRMRCIKDYVCYIEQRASNAPITEEELFNWLLKAKQECLPQELQNRGVFPDVESIIRNKDIPTIRLWVAYMLEKFRSRRLFGWRMIDFLKKAGMKVSIIEVTPKSEKDSVSLTESVKVCSSVIKAEEISKIANANILNHEMVDHLENKPKKTLEDMHALSRYRIADCYNMTPESITEDFISEYGKYDHMKWFRSYKKLRDAGINNETAVEAITREDYRNDRLTTVTQSEKHRICLEILKTCTPVKDIDDRNKYKTDIIKRRLESPESIKFLQGLVPKMARVFDNTDSFRRAKKSGLKTLRAKLGLLNSALYTTYGLKLKGTNNKHTHYHLVGEFDDEDAPKLPPYQTGEGPFYENGEDIRYGYSKLPPDELETSSNSITQDTQDLIDIC